MEKITNFKDKCIIIRIRHESIDIRGSLYEAVRRCWRASKERAEEADYVLAVVGRSRVVEAVFKPSRWYYLDDEFCKNQEEVCKTGYGVNTDLCKIKRRIAFEGEEIPHDTNYLHKQIPDKYSSMQNPVRYTY